MSEFIGEAFVALRPDASRFAPEAQAQVDRAMAQVRAPAVQVPLSGRESLLGLAESTRQIRLAESVAEQEALSEAFKRLSQEGRDSVENVRAEAARVKAEFQGAAVAAGDVATATGRAGGSIAGAVVRATGFGLALAAGVQAVGHLQDALRATGQEAFTTGGRIRNAVSELIDADIVGAFKGLTAQASSVEDLGGARAAAAQLDELREAAEQAERAEASAGRELGRFGAIGRIAAGGLNELRDLTGQSADEARRLYEEARLAAQGVLELDAAAKQALTSVLGLRDAQGNLIVGSTPGQQFRLAAGSPAGGFSAQSGVSPPPNEPSAALAQEQALAAAKRRNDLVAQQELLEEQLRIAINRVNIVQAGNTRLYNERVREEQAARNALDAVNDQIAATNALIREQATQNAIARAGLTAGTADDVREINKAIADLQREAQTATPQRKGEIEAAIIGFRSQLQAINEQNAAAAAAAAETATSARQLELANNEAKAALTKRKTDDIAAINATIDYFKSLVEATTGLERAQARQALIAARGRLADVLQPGAAEPSEAGAIAELRLQNQRARAQLTKRLDDDRAAINAQIRYYRELVKNSEGLEKEQARARLIASRLALQQLNAAKEQTGQGTTAFDLLQQAARTFTENAGNLIGPDQPFKDPTGFTADLAQWLRRQESPAASGRGGFPTRFELNDDRIIRALDRLADALAGETASKPRPPQPGSGALDRNDKRFREAEVSRAFVGGMR